MEDIYGRRKSKKEKKLKRSYRVYKRGGKERATQSGGMETIN